MRMRQFWQKVGKDERIDYLSKWLFTEYPRKGNGFSDLHCSWRRRKKEEKMKAKKNGKILFFLDYDNYYKADRIYAQSDLFYRELEKRRTNLTINIIQNGNKKGNS